MGTQLLYCCHQLLSVSRNNLSIEYTRRDDTEPIKNCVAAIMVVLAGEFSRCE